MQGKELNELAFRKIQNDRVLWTQWCEAINECDRNNLKAEVIAEYVAEFCIGEVYGADEPWMAAKAIRNKFERE